MTVHNQQKEMLWMMLFVQISTNLWIL